MKTERTNYTGLEVAIVGMACRFPAAANWRVFWKRLVNAEESVEYLSEDQLASLGVPREQFSQKGFIKARNPLPCRDTFDVGFFEYRTEEAKLISPATRVFHECIWEALEDAAYDPGQVNGGIGLFAGSNENTAWKNYARNLKSDIDFLTLDYLTHEDYLTTLLSYKLNLKGPSIYVNTACSTALVAVDLACKSLLLGESRMAIAGGVSILSEEILGYKPEEGMIASADGRCRAFDKDASGTIRGEGAGAVVLKRLSNALEDGDHIYAVIKGSATNNDGNRKVGFSAPSVEGQFECIRKAQRFAKAEPSTITYIEAHGTGTFLGDPIEVEALNKAFQNDTRHSCAIGSVKTNIGHLDVVAGIAGLIKTALSLKYKMLPATLHFKEPNPNISFDDGPFYVNSQLCEWTSAGNAPLRAGVSSFGIGGTNAHVIVEEPPSFPVSIEKEQPNLLVISAKTKSALLRFANELRSFISNEVNLNLRDLSYTLQVGRRAFPYRYAASYRDKAGLLKILDTLVPENITLASERDLPRLFLPAEPNRELGNDCYVAGSSLENLLKTYADLWQNGYPVQWAVVHGIDKKRRRIPLPTYSFEPVQFNVNFLSRTNEVALKSSVTPGGSLIYIPIWKPSYPAPIRPEIDEKRFLYFSCGKDFSVHLKSQILEYTSTVVEVVQGETFKRISYSRYIVNPHLPADYEKLLEDLNLSSIHFTDVIYDWAHTDSENENSTATHATSLPVFMHLVDLLKALYKNETSEWVRLTLITHSVQPVLSTETGRLGQSLLFGFLNAAKQERRTDYVAIDIDDHTSSLKGMVTDIYRNPKTREKSIAYRSGRRWVLDYQQQEVERSKHGINVKHRGVYLITGGLGEAGYVLAKHMIEHYAAKIALIGRSDVEMVEPSARIIKRFRSLKELSHDVRYFKADVGQYEELESAVLAIEAEWGAIDGVIHAAGITDISNFQLIENIEVNEAKKMMKPKVLGLENIYRLFKDRETDFVWITSSISSVLGGVSYASYAAANTYMQYFIWAFAAELPNWRCVALPALAFSEQALQLTPDGLKASEFIDIFHLALSQTAPVIITTKIELQEQIDKRASLPLEASSVQMKISRPNCSTDFANAETDIEKKLQKIFEDFFGFDAIGVNDDFFELGGDSLKGMMLLKRLKVEFNVDIPLMDLLMLPTIRLIAVQIEEIQWLTADATTTNETII